MSAPSFWVDTSRCSGCGACLIACQDRAGLGDESVWLRVRTCEEGRYPQVRVSFDIVHCWHCERPACAEVCPVEALTRDADGWVHLASDICIGCGACLTACPYDCLQLLPEGVASKCDGCADWVAAGHQPVCVNACPMRALGFGEKPVRPPEIVVDAHYDHAGISPRVERLVRRPPATKR